MGSLCTQKMLATAPQIARATLGRATPLAHPNAPSRALYGPGVARPRTKSYIHIYIIYKNDICLLSFIMIFMIKILMLINILIYINQPLAHPNALSRALDGPGVARPRTQPQKRHARVLSTRRDASRDPFALKRCVCSKHAAPQNSWPSDQPLVHQNPSY